MLIPCHTKSAFLCKIITHKITKTTTRVYCNSQERAIQCLHLVDGTKRTSNDNRPHATPQVVLFIDLYIWVMA